MDGQGRVFPPSGCSLQPTSNLSAAQELAMNSLVESKQNVLQKIDAIVAGQIRDLMDGRTLTMPIGSRSKKPRNPNWTAQDDATSNVKLPAFPGKTGRVAWKFAVILAILNIIHKALSEGLVVTKRDIYYQDPVLFMSQSIVDRLIDDIAFHFGVSRRSLNVTAESKGLVNGTFMMHKRDGSMVAGASNTEGLPVPDPFDITSVDLSRVNWTLVIEKKATFHTLSQTNFSAGVSSGGILITAQGYPDLLTRSFIHYIHTSAPHIPVYCLVDYDPDGLSIYTTYAFGSAALAHEHGLAVPQMRLLGLKSEDLVPVPWGIQRINDRDSPATGVKVEDEPSRMEQRRAEFPALSTRERKNARARLARWCAEADDCDHEADQMAELRREIQIMLMLGFKAEIQILDQREGGLERWCRAKLRHY